MPIITNLEVHSTIRATRPELLVRALIIANGAKLPFPTMPMVRWLEQITTDYDNTFRYWFPYNELKDGTITAAPWGRGALGYLAGTGTEVPKFEDIDPAIWHHGLALNCRQYVMDDQTKVAVDLMAEQTNPEEDGWGPQVEELIGRVRNAIAYGTLVVDPARIRRHVAKLKARGH